MGATLDDRSKQKPGGKGTVRRERRECRHSCTQCRTDSHPAAAPCPYSSGFCCGCPAFGKKKSLEESFLVF